MGLRNICTRHFKHHYGGSFTSYIMIFGFVIEMSPTMSKCHVKESQSRAALPLFAQAGVGA